MLLLEKCVDLALVFSRFQVHESLIKTLVHWDGPEGWYGEGGGRRVREGNTCIPVADSF